MSGPSAAEKTPSAKPEASRGIPRWKKVVVTCAAFLLVAGLGLRASAMRDDKPADGREVTHSRGTTSTMGTGNFGAGLVDGGGGTSDPTRLPGFPRTGSEAPPRQVADGGVTDYSPALLKGGLSFFVGICVGFAVRTFLKISFIVVGLVALAIFGLQHFGLIQVDMVAIEGHFDNLVGKVGDQTSDFKNFISGTLPSAGMAGLGLFTGIKRG
jgi:uncharacterized membrane protein (Fun14 family)